jgi:LPS-assembly protein
MKNNINFLKITLIFYLIFYSNLTLSEELKFNASEISTYGAGNLIKGTGGVEITDGLNLTIKGAEFEYNKLKSVLKIKKNVLVQDKLNKNQIKSDQITYYVNKKIIISIDKTIIELGDNHIIESSNVTYDKKSSLLFSNENTVITNINNKMSMKSFSFSMTQKILTTKNAKIYDNKGNLYSVKNIKYNIKTNEILGKDLSLVLHNENSNSNGSKPRLKGNTFSYKDNLTQINKGVFTTCKKNDSCPPWVLNSQKIEHDKIKKTITYKNAWLKIYDIPVLYFPRFFHPDPTVKRQSGFLKPQFSQSNNLGNYFSIPYFHAISINSDLTFTPRLYSDGKALYQTEYRNYNKKSEHVLDFSALGKNLNIFHENDNSSASHFFLKSKFDVDLKNFSESQIDLKIQQTTNDNYLKTYKIKSPLIESDNTLHSSLNLNVSREGLEAHITAETYENLSLSTSDRFEYIYPSFNILKNIGEFDQGSLALNSSGSNKQFNTNAHESILVNDLNYKSYNKISTLGLISHYEVLLKNFNVKANKSTTYNNKTENSLQSIINYQIKYPLKKIGENYLSTLTPILSARYSPNQTKDKSTNDRFLDLDNIFSINRIGFSDTVEGGQSITIGNEYSLQNKINNKNIFSAGIATVVRDVENTRLPTSSTIGEKNSDIFGDIHFKASEFLDFDYNFALDNNLKTSNFNQIKSTLTFYNLVSTFDFLERNNIMGSESFISNETKIEINKSSSLSFKTRKNKNTDLTEYYNLLYEYKNDCLTAGIEFKKDFYSDGSLRPEEGLFFSITIMPLGKFSSPDINQ